MYTTVSEREETTALLVHKVGVWVELTTMSLLAKRSGLAGARLDMVDLLLTTLHTNYK